MRILLRLDDGSIIGHIDSESTVKKVSPDEAFALGRLTERDKQRIKNLIEQTFTTVASPTAGKRKELDTPEGQGNAKRSKTKQANGRRATSDSRVSEPGGAGWEEKCQSILQKVLDSLGIEAQWFDRPVDEFYIPGYYSKIKNPMDLGTMKQKLITSKYKGPDEFCKDMRQVWDNCISFNGKGSKYGHIGDRTSTMFEQMWAGSGLESGGSRHRRVNAGVPSTKYDEEIDEPEPKPRSLRKQPSTRTANSNKSHRHDDEAGTLPMDREHMHSIAGWMGNIGGEELEGAIKILRDRGFGGTGDEIELDFEALDNDTLWALDDYMVSLKEGGATSGGNAASGFQVEPESDYESDDSDISE